MTLSKMFFLFAIVGAISLEIVADIFLKQWSIEKQTGTLLVGLGIYAIGTLLWAFALCYENISTAIVIFTLFNLIAVILIGVYFFGEQLSVTNKAGILLGLISMVLLEL